MVELTNRLRRLVASLDDARVRREEGLFVAEGTKCVLDTLRYFPLRYLFATSAWISRYNSKLKGLEVTQATRADMERMSQLTTPPEVIAVYEIPSRDIREADIAGNLIIALDRVQDPGNLGTIMRVADWFGIRDIVCSRDTVDLYNPKVVQATMGAIARVRVYYTDLPEWLNSCGLPVYGTFLHGDNIYDARLDAAAVIVMGNEGKGISDEVAEKVGRRITIPSYPLGAVASESLNVGTATAVTVAEFRRRQL